jgi:transposase
LDAQLQAGRTIEAIGAEVGKHPSTIGYWVNKHGLASQHAQRVASRGGIEPDLLGHLVERGLSIRGIAAELGVAAGTVRHWLERHGLRTQPARYAGRGAPAGAELVRECSRHGWSTFRRTGPRGSFRCAACQTEAVTRRRRQVKAILVEEAGGACAICGYSRHVGALQFHHVDPKAKAFEIGGRGLTLSLETLRAEARKCELLCANCHAEVEAGVTRLPFTRAIPG